jgi:hypothetical protein
MYLVRNTSPRIHAGPYGSGISNGMNAPMHDFDPWYSYEDEDAYDIGASDPLSNIYMI